MVKRTMRQADRLFPFYGHGLPSDELLIWFRSDVPGGALAPSHEATLEARGPRGLRLVRAPPESPASGDEWLQAHARFVESVLQLNASQPIELVVAPAPGDLDGLDQRHTTSLASLARDADFVAAHASEAPRFAYETLTHLVVYAGEVAGLGAVLPAVVAALAQSLPSRDPQWARAARTELVRTCASLSNEREREALLPRLAPADQLDVALSAASDAPFSTAERMAPWARAVLARAKDATDAEAALCVARALAVGRLLLSQAMDPPRAADGSVREDTGAGGTPEHQVDGEKVRVALALVTAVTDAAPGSLATRALRLALQATLGEWPPVDASFRASIIALREHPLEAQITLAEATAHSRADVAEAWMTELGATDLCEDPLILGNVLYWLNARQRFDESARRAACHIEAELRLTPVLVTNALLAFAGARRWDFLVAAFALDAEQRLAEGDGRFFRPSVSQRRDLRGSAHANLALVFGTAGDDERVLAHLRAAKVQKYADLEILPNEPHFAATAQKAVIRSFFTELAAVGDEARSQAIRANPRDWWARFSRGLEAHNRGDLATALADYNVVLDLAPSYPDTYINLGNIRWTSAMDLTGAVDWYGRALALAPDHLTGLRNRGEALLLLGRIEEAERDLSRVLALDARHPLPHFLLAVCHAAPDADRKKLAKARAFAKSGAKLDPQMSTVDLDAPYRSQLLSLLGRSSSSPSG